MAEPKSGVCGGRHDAVFASARERTYIRPMAIFPRPVSPRSAAGDLWSYLTERRAHKWPLLGLSMAFTWLIVWAFLVDANTNTMPTRNKIIYFESWDASRSDAAIILQQKLDLAEREARLREKQQDMQKVADMFGIEWRDEARRNDARRSEALKVLNADLDRRFLMAKAEEKGEIDGNAVGKLVDKSGRENEATTAPASVASQ